MNLPATAPLFDDAIRVCDAAQTAQLLSYRAIVQQLAIAAPEYEAGRIFSPPRVVIPLGPDGCLISMPATAHDVGVHKLVSFHPGNAQRGLATIHGVVTVCDAATGRPFLMLDGPEVTGRRTTAISMLAIQTLANAPPQDILLFGTGIQARHHVQAIHEMYPQALIRVRGRTVASTAAFCERMQATHPLLQPCPDAIPDSVDVVITVTTSTNPVYDAPARAGRLVVAVGAFQPGMAEIGKTTLDGSTIFCDDPAGARHEAGDLLRAGVDWQRVRSLGALLQDGAGATGPFVFKSVGSAAWDLAAARAAVQAL